MFFIFKGTCGKNQYENHLLLTGISSNCRHAAVLVVDLWGHRVDVSFVFTEHSQPTTAEVGPNS